MNRVQASACPWRSVVAACRALPASVSLTLMLVALACASVAPQARAGSFDWRSRGILFRIVADVPVDAGPGSAAATSPAIGVDAIPSPPPPMTTATQEIGRAACRERVGTEVKNTGVHGSLKKKQT